MDNPVGALDAYELTNLVEHLESSGRSSDVLRLLRLEWIVQDLGAYRNAWFVARSARGDIEGYARDLGRALGMLDRELPAAGPDRRPGLVADQVYLALALATLQSRSDSLPTALIERLLLIGRPYAITLARTIPAPGWRAKTLALLAPHLPPAERAPVVDELIELAAAAAPNLEYVAPFLAPVVPFLSAEDGRRVYRRLRDVRYQRARAETLAALAPMMTDAELNVAVIEVLRLPDAVKEAALAGLAPHLPEYTLDDCVRDALRWPHRARQLATLAPWLTADGLRRAVAAIRALDRADPRTRLLAVVLPSLPPADRDELLPEVLDGFARLPLEKRETAEALAHLLPALTARQRDGLLGRTVRKLSGRTRWFETRDVLITLAPHLSGSLRRKALRIVRADDPRDRATALAAFVPGASARRQRALAREALRAVEQVPEPHQRAEPIVDVMIAMDPAAREAILADWLAAADRPLSALRGISRTQWEEQWDRLAPHLPDEAVGTLEERFSAADDAGLWALPLLRLHGRPADDTLRPRLASVRPAGSPLLVAFGLHTSLPPAERAAVVGEAVAATRSSPQRMIAVPALLPLLDPADRAPVVAAETERVAGSNYADSARATVAVETAPFLSDDALREAVRRAAALGEQSERAWALTGLAPQLPERLVADAAELAETLDYPGHRCKLLVALARRSDGAARAGLLDRAQDLLEQSLRGGHPLTTEAAAVAELLRGDKLERLLATCLQTLPRWGRISGTHAVRPLMPLWSAERRRQALATLEGFADRDEQHPARDELGVIGRMLTRADLLDLRETFLPGTLPPAAIRDMVRQLAEVRVRDDGDILRTSRATAIVRLARHLPGDTRTELADRALELVRTERLRATTRGERQSGWPGALSDLAVVGDDAFARRLLAEAADITDDETRAGVLAKLASRFAELAPTGRDEAWCELLRAATAHGRAALLADLVAMRPAVATVAGRDPATDVARAFAQVVVFWP
ncbi:hypothetical protein AB0F81_04850 [Actinoplanes sp. NPDC024001]|uniref:hypothetical protein n=1 Tax=Actinoplanes sp. NPDC024001 TaxID=3154598 RepID=UPI0033F427B6